MPEISVIIPTYQHGDRIAKTLELVFCQSFKDIEVIVINDGSTDGTAGALKPYLGKIKYKEIANSGAPKARNEGFALSSGKYVIFCDADVTDIDSEMLNEMRKALIDAPSASYAYCGFRFGMARFRPQAFDPEKLKLVNYIHTTSLIRREDFPGFDESIRKFQDWDLWLTMLERGKTGIAVMKTMISFAPRGGGMSRWLPKALYSDFLPAIGLRLKTVEKYFSAKAVIAKKHSLPAPEKKEPTLWPWFLVAFAASALSFAWTPIGNAVALSVAAVALLAVRQRLVYGAAFMLSELLFGSLAGKTLAFSVYGHAIPLRYALFAIVGGYWILRLAQRRIRPPDKRLALGITIALSAVIWGIANGSARGLGIRNVFFDANAYFFLPTILIFFSSAENEKDQRLLLNVLKHGAIAISALTLAALFFFSHRFWNPAGVFAYKWLRDTRIAEITALSGGTYRVFIQSQIFCLLSFITLAFREKKENPKALAWGLLPASALAVSGSRSFALGLIAAAAAWLAFMALKGDRPLLMMKRGLSPLGKIAAFGAISAVIYALLLLFPFPQARSQASFQDMLRSRSVSERDAATASRWSLLKALDAKIAESPLLGSGFGSTVTYRSSDPRIISTTGGTYTTGAFEWNYHDIAVKMGIVGLAAFAFLLWAVFSVLRKSGSRRAWTLPAFFALLAVNAVSPYLNHPLGIGFLALLIALSEDPAGNLAAVPVASSQTQKLAARPANAVPSGALLTEE